MKILCVIATFLLLTGCSLGQRYDAYTQAKIIQSDQQMQLAKLKHELEVKRLELEIEKTKTIASQPLVNMVLPDGTKLTVAQPAGQGGGVVVVDGNDKFQPVAIEAPGEDPVVGVAKEMFGFAKSAVGPVMLGVFGWKAIDSLAEKIGSSYSSTGDMKITGGYNSESTEVVTTTETTTATTTTTENTSISE